MYCVTEILFATKIRSMLNFSVWYRYIINKNTYRVKRTFLRLCQARPARGGIMLSSLNPFVPFQTVNTIFWKGMNRFWRQIAQVVHGSRVWNGQPWWSEGQRSRSHEAEGRFGGLADASFSTTLGRVAFFKFENTLGLYSESLTHFTKHDIWVNLYAF